MCERESENIVKILGVCRFSHIPSHKYPEGATPAQISHHNMDLSYCMETMLKNYSNGIQINVWLRLEASWLPSPPPPFADETGLLGELQFSFVCFLVGQGLLPNTASLQLIMTNC